MLRCSTCKIGLVLAAVVFVFFLAPRLGEAADPIRVVFLAPYDNAEHPFWKNYTLFMAEAARDLGVNLDVVRAGDRYSMVDEARRILFGPHKPDYFITVYLKGAGKAILDIAAENGVPVFLVNTMLQREDRRRIGCPRGKYANWIGYMYPDEAAAGRDLGTALIAMARKEYCDRIHMIAIAGSHDNPSALERNEGLLNAVDTAGDVTLDRLLFGFWDDKIAYGKTQHMLAMSRDTRVVWAASDSMALGACRAVLETGRILGSDVFVGGFDWSAEGLDSVERGLMAASVGGHFMEGAWALVLVYDHHMGKDFAPENLECCLPMYLVEAHNVRDVRLVMDTDKWSGIDFRCFSKACNGGKPYKFSFGAVLDCLKKGR